MPTLAITPNLFPSWTYETPATMADKVALLERICRDERKRALAGHWTYNQTRHQALVRELQAARAAVSNVA